MNYFLILCILLLGDLLFSGIAFIRLKFLKTKIEAANPFLTHKSLKFYLLKRQDVNDLWFLITKNIGGLFLLAFLCLLFYIVVIK